MARLWLPGRVVVMMNEQQRAAHVRELRADAEACRRVAEGLRANRWRCSTDGQRRALDFNARSNEQTAQRLEAEAEALATVAP